MGVIDKFFTAHQGDQAVAALDRIATAFERIAMVAETFLPKETVYPDKPVGPENIGEYGGELKLEDIEDMRQKLREQGLTDRQIEDRLVREMFAPDAEDDDA